MISDPFLLMLVKRFGFSVISPCFAIRILPNAGLPTNMLSSVEMLSAKPIGDNHPGASLQMNSVRGSRHA